MTMKKHDATNQPDRTQQKENAAKAKPHNVLEAFEYIAELAESSNLDADFMQKATPAIEYAEKTLQLPSMQVFLLALFV